MSYSMTAYISRGEAAHGTGPTSILARLRTFWQVRQEYRRTVFELNSCSNRELDDLGIARCDIPEIAREAVAKRG